MSGAFSIVIPNWNGRDLLERFLPAVAAAAGDSEIVVSDDGSTDGSCEWLARAHPQIKVTRSDANRGFAPTANAGVAAASAPFVILLNNDLEPRADLLAKLPEWFLDPGLFGVTFRAFDLPERIFSTGGKIGRFRRGFWESWRNFESGGRESFLLVGGFCAFRREAFLEMGGFDPMFAPYYSEDVDLSYRARKRGWRLGYEPEAMVWHAPSSSVKRHRGRFARQVIIERNRLLFHWRNLDAGKLAGHLLWAHLLLPQMALKGQWAYHAGYVQALARVGQVRRFRRAERSRWVARDEDLAVEAGETSHHAGAGI